VAHRPASGRDRLAARSRARAEWRSERRPEVLLCPTPAGFASDGGSALVAAASSLAPAVVVFDGATGWSRAASPRRARRWRRPCCANGRLITATIAGAIEALASSVNHAPSAPIAAPAARPFDRTEVTLRWLPAADPDAELPTYEVRIDDDGELLQDWQQQVHVGAGVTSAAADDAAGRRREVLVRGARAATRAARCRAGRRWRRSRW
jgi:hypothetical protein